MSHAVAMRDAEQPDYHASKPEDALRSLLRELRSEHRDAEHAAPRQRPGLRAGKLHFASLASLAGSHAQ